MTKDELKKEAEENSFRYTLDKPWVCEVERKQIMAHFEKGYLAGAEPRENKIADIKANCDYVLEGKEIEYREERNKLCDDFENMKAGLESKIAELEEYKNGNFVQTVNQIIEGKDKRLEQATEIIKDLMSFSVQLCDCRHTVDFEKTREQAVQFIKEIEKC